MCNRRNVYNINYRAHCDPILSRLELLKFEDLYKINVQSFMYDYFHSNKGSFFVWKHAYVFSWTQPKKVSKVKKVRSKTLESFTVQLFFQRFGIQLSFEYNELKLKSLAKVTFEKYNLFKWCSLRCYFCNPA